MKKPKKKSPSRIKYDEKHPVVSFRVSKELYDRLQAVKIVEGKSNIDILKAGLEPHEVKIRTEKEIWDKACDKGFQEGMEIAEKEFAVSYPCSVCRKEIIVSSEVEKRDIRRYMREQGWGHADCINRS